MRLLWLIIFVVLNVYRTNGTSNDIVGTMRCRLLCEEANGYGSELKDGKICRCNILKTLSDKQQLRVQELSSYYNLPVLFERERHNYKVKRQLEDNFLEEWRSKLDETAENWKAWKDQQAKENPVLGEMEQYAENVKAWHEQQARSNSVMSGLEDHVDNLKNWHKQHFEENPILSDLEEHASNLKAWHDDNLEILQDGIQEQKDKLEEHMENLKDVNVGNIGPKLEEHVQQLKDFHDEHIEPLLGASLPSIPTIEESMDKIKSLPTIEESMDKLKSFYENQHEQNEPILGQMAPSLVTYDSKATGIGGSNVNFPKPEVPNPFVPGLAHIINALPIPRFNIPVGSAPHAPVHAQAVPATHIFTPHVPALPHLFSRSHAAPGLPANYAGPYNPKNPIVVQPIIIPTHNNPSPKPILSSLQRNVDEMLAHMKKHNGRLDVVNSDALSNSESQVNQINVNVRVEPTPPPPNLYSMFLPWNRNWLAAPAPQNTDENGNVVTENPGMIDDSAEEGSDKQRDSKNDGEEEEEDFEEERRMQKQLNDVEKSKFNAHVVDSVKKNLATNGKSDTNSAKYGGGLIVQPKEFMQDTEEDLETLAK